MKTEWGAGTFRRRYQGQEAVGRVWDSVPTLYFGGFQKERFSCIIEKEKKVGRDNTTERRVRRYGKDTDCG